MRPESYEARLSSLIQIADPQILKRFQTKLQRFHLMTLEHGATRFQAWTQDLIDESKLHGLQLQIQRWFAILLERERSPSFLKQKSQSHAHGVRTEQTSSYAMSTCATKHTLYSARWKGRTLWSKLYKITRRTGCYETHCHVKAKQIYGKKE